MAAVALLLLAVERVPEGSVRLRLRDGEVAAVLEPGLHLRMPGARVTYRTGRTVSRLTLPLTLPEGSTVELSADAAVRLPAAGAARLWRAAGEGDVGAATSRLMREAAERLGPEASAALLEGTLGERIARDGREALEGAGLVVEELEVTAACRRHWVEFVVRSQSFGSQQTSPLTLNSLFCQNRSL